MSSQGGRELEKYNSKETHRKRGLKTGTTTSENSLENHLKSQMRRRRFKRFSTSNLLRKDLLL
jgi:hypothetical protein